MNIHSYVQIAELGVGLNSLIDLHYLTRRTEIFDFMVAVDAAIDAGVDRLNCIVTDQNAIEVLPLLKTVLQQRRVQVQVVVEVGAPVGEWFDDSLPDVLCWVSRIDADSLQLSPLKWDDVAQLKRQAEYWQARHVLCAACIPADQKMLESVAEATCLSVWFLASSIGKNLSDGSANLQTALCDCAMAATGRGMKLGLIGDACFPGALSSLLAPDITMLMLDQVLFASAFRSGWEKAVRDAKALFVKTRLSSR